jgi:hypothetical protein
MVAGLAVLAATGCALAQGSPMRRLAAADSAYTLRSGFEESRHTVVRDAVAWAALWQELHAGRRPVPPTPEIDFEREMVVLAALGRQRSGGFDIVIESVRREESEVIVTLVERSPGSDCITTAELTSPADLAIVPWDERPVRFVAQRVVVAC